MNVIENTLSLTDTLLGSEFSLADIILVTCLDWALAYDFELPQNISEYHKRIIDRDAYIRAVNINFKD